jgi:hypothetical protein
MVVDTATGRSVLVERGLDGPWVSRLGYCVCGSHPLAVRIVATALNDGRLPKTGLTDSGDPCLTSAALRRFFGTLGSVEKMGD